MKGKGKWSKKKKRKEGLLLGLSYLVNNFSYKYVSHMCS